MTEPLILSTWSFGKKANAAGWPYLGRSRGVEFGRGRAGVPGRRGRSGSLERRPRRLPRPFRRGLAGRLDHAFAGPMRIGVLRAAVRASRVDRPAGDGEAASHVVGRRRGRSLRHAAGDDARQPADRQRAGDMAEVGHRAPRVATSGRHDLLSASQPGRVLRHYPGKCAAPRRKPAAQPESRHGGSAGD